MFIEKELLMAFETSREIIVKVLAQEFPNDLSVKKLSSLADRSRGTIVKTLQKLKAEKKVREYRYGRLKRWCLSGDLYENLASPLVKSYLNTEDKVCHGHSNRSSYEE
jgi:hypothetical protein